MSRGYILGGNVHANGIRQHYLRYGGSGRRLVIVPGITSPAITWGFVAEAFAGRYDVYVLDVRGRGLSEAGDDLDYGVDACAADVAAFVAALDLGDAVLLGHSMGARHIARAVALGLRTPAVILADPPVSGPGRREYPSKLPWYVDSIALARQGTDAEGLRPFSPTWTDAARQLRAEWLHTCDERAIRQSFEEFHTRDFHADLPSLTMPTLLLTAGIGDVVRDSDVAEIAGLVPHLATARLPLAGHMLPWDDLDGFVHAVSNFIDTLSSGDLQ